MSTKTQEVEPQEAKSVVADAADEDPTTASAHRFGPTATPRARTAGLVAIALAVAPLVLGDYGAGILALYLPLVILALSVDILWGMNGVVSFGHAAFFTAGAYLAALIIGGPGDASAGTLNYLQEAPSGGSDRWARLFEALSGVAPLGVPVLALLLPTVAIGAVGLLLGWVLFRLPQPEVYVPLMTLGLGVIMTTSLVGIPFLGASNGLSNIPALLADSPIAGGMGSGTSRYVANLVALLAVYAAYWFFRKSMAGKRWLASGDEPLRLDSLGYRTQLIRAGGFAASVALAALAGTMSVTTTGFVAPGQAAVGQSAMILIWVAVGRPGGFFGPLIGTLLIQVGSFLLSGILHNSWQLVLGLVLISVVVFGTRSSAWRARLRRLLPADRLVRLVPWETGRR